MKRTNHLIRAIAFLCLMLISAWGAAGCGNIAGFTSQTGDTDNSRR